MTVGVGAFSIAISFAMSSVIQNLVSSILMMSYKYFVPGDEITIQGFTGRVVKIGIRTTVIEQEDGNKVLIPNSVFISSPVVRMVHKDDSEPYMDLGRALES